MDLIFNRMDIKWIGS